jgi:hypothetical protein
MTEQYIRKGKGKGKGTGTGTGTGNRVMPTK